MKRMTFDGNFCDIAMCAEMPCKYPDGGCSQKQVWERLKAFEDAEEQGLLVKLPCKVGDTIIAFRYSEEKGLYYIADRVTAVTTNKNGWTIKTKSKFYPIRAFDGDEVAPISKYPFALADYYIGTETEAEAALKEMEVGNGTD